MTRRLSTPATVTLSLAVGLTIGMLIAAYAPAAFADRLVSVAEPVGTLWVNAIRMTVIPLVVPLLIVGVAGAADVRRIGGLGARAIGIFLLMLTLLAIATAMVGPILLGGMELDPARAAGLRSAAEITLPPAEQLTVRSWILSLVPTNPIRAAADGALLPLVVFTLAYAFALGRAAPDVRASQVSAFRGISDVMMDVVRFVLALAPVGIFALALSLGARLGTAAVGLMGYYVGVVIALHLLTTPLLYAMAVFGGGVPLRRFARAVLPAQVVGFSSRSSLASLPALVTGARDLLHLSPAATGFVLPLAVSVFKLTSAIYWTIGALFVARLYGIELSGTQVATIAAGSVVLNASTPGIPSGGLLIQAPLYAAVGLPVEGLGILIAIDAIPDMFKTAFNVTADMAVAVLLDRSPGATPAVVPAVAGA